VDVEIGLVGAVWRQNRVFLEEGGINRGSLDGAVTDCSARGLPTLAVAAVTKIQESCAVTSKWVFPLQRFGHRSLWFVRHADSKSWPNDGGDMENLRRWSREQLRPAFLAAFRRQPATASLLTAELIKAREYGSVLDNDLVAEAAEQASEFKPNWQVYDKDVVTIVEGDGTAAD